MVSAQRIIFTRTRSHLGARDKIDNASRHGTAEVKNIRAVIKPLGEAWKTNVADQTDASGGLVSAQ